MSDNILLLTDYGIRLFDFPVYSESMDIKDRIIQRIIQFNSSFEAIQLDTEKNTNYFFELSKYTEDSFEFSYSKSIKDTSKAYSTFKWYDTKTYKLVFTDNKIKAKLTYASVSGFKNKFNIKHRQFMIDCDTDFDEIWYSLLNHLDIYE